MSFIGGSDKLSLKAGEEVTVYGTYNNANNGPKWYFVNTGKSGDKEWMFVEQGKVINDDSLVFAWPINNTAQSSVNNSVFGYRIFEGTEQRKDAGGNPVKDKDRKIIYDTYVYYNFHRGVDMPGSGRAVKAAAAGTVTYAQFDDQYGGGNMVVIEHQNGLQTRYQHLASITQKAKDSFKNKSKIALGVQIGVSGSTGNSGGAHLHFEIMRSDTRNSQINPLEFYSRHDIRSCPNRTNKPNPNNPNPAFKLVGGNFVFNPDFKWDFSTDGEPNAARDFTGVDYPTTNDFPKTLKEEFEITMPQNRFFCGHRHY